MKQVELKFEVEYRGKSRQRMFWHFWSSKSSQHRTNSTIFYSNNSTPKKASDSDFEGRKQASSQRKHEFKNQDETKLMKFLPFLDY